MNKVIPAFICVAFILMLTGCKKKKFNDAIYDARQLSQGSRRGKQIVGNI